jgi:N-acetylglucosaminyldiphosphoundecaprenol N-acetyl-beta-D-mannosaminyltransferase
MRKRLLDQPIDTLNLTQATYFAKMALLNPKQLKIITLNPEMIVNAEKKIEFQAALNNANMVIADGTGIAWALKYLNPGEYEDFERVPGIELAEKIVLSANELSKKIAIYGGTKEVLEKIVKVFSEKYPKVDIVKTIDGFSEKNDLEIAKEIAYECPNVILVALGSPKQELWIEKYSYLFPKSIMIGVGGTLDVWSGEKERAPDWARDLHLEWLYRVLSEPKRIPRLLSSHPRFVYMVLKRKMVGNYTP